MIYWEDFCWSCRVHLSVLRRMIHVNGTVRFAVVSICHQKVDVGEDDDDDDVRRTEFWEFS